MELLQDFFREFLVLVVLIVGSAGIFSAIAGGFVSAVLSNAVSNTLFAILLAAGATRIFFEQLRVANA